MIIDDHSRAVPGYAVNLTAPSSLQTALALRQVPITAAKSAPPIAAIHNLRRPAPSVATVHRAVAIAAAAHGWDAPSYSTVRDIIGGLDASLVTLAQQGTKAYQQAYDLLYRREAAAPNEMWQADHTQLDLLVLDQAGRPGRG